MAINANHEPGSLARIGNGWNQFWFLPRDPYVLGLLRLLTALVALWWYLGYYSNLQNWFGPEGMFTAEAAEQLRSDPDIFAPGATSSRFAVSYLDWIDSASLLTFVYFLGLAAIILMGLGLFSRISTIATLVVVISFLHRAPMLQRPVDDLLVIILLYLCFGPCGASFSFDAWLRRKRADRTSTFHSDSSLPMNWSWSATLATRLLQIHLVLIYAATVLAQLQGEDWWQGMSIWVMMARPESRLIDLTSIAGLGSGSIYLINFLTHAATLYQICFVFLIWNRTARPILLALGVFFWLGLAMIGGAPSHAVLMLVANVAFIEPATLRGWFAKCTNKTSAVPSVAAA